ncbi:MAG: 5'/3'-nucleotidase SurE [Bacteroidales bacterium]|nr:5'/3'-nucleotidase SurE [Bacteroidales bacterium]
MMSNKEMTILVVNDDGFEASGLEAMVSIARNFGNVTVVVPDRTRSGMGHAITMNEPLRLSNYKNEGGISYWRTNGTPVDCVKLGEKVLLRDKKIDLVLSGINHGSNSSVSLIYSGTMAAAIEACFSNMPAIGISLLDYSPNADFTAAVHYGKIIVGKAIEKGIPAGTCLNVNVPKVPVDEIKGVKVTRQCDGVWQEDLLERVDAFGRKYYWLTGHLEHKEFEPDTCEWALNNNFVSVQPVQYDLTAHKHIPELKYLEL